MYVTFKEKGMNKFPNGYRVYCREADRKMFLPDDLVDGLEALGGSIVGEPNESKNDAATQEDFDEVFAKLVAQNDTSNFTVDGLPKIHAVRREMGASVSKSFMLEAWDKFCEANPKPKSDADLEVEGGRAMSPEVFQGNKKAESTPAPEEPAPEEPAE